jgi:hypothetical protein
MKKLLLIAVAVSGLVIIAAQRSGAQPAVLVSTGDLVLDSLAATPLIRRTLIIIPTGTTGARTFTTILIRIITAPHPMGAPATAATTVIIGIIATTVSDPGGTDFDTVDR